MSSFRFGSHLPALIKLVSITDGPIVEFGTGFNSTIFLHWACHATDRKLVSYESKWEYYKQMRRLRSESHEIHLVKAWDNTIGSGKWSIVFIDHSPGFQRGIDAARFTDSEYVVLHDSEPENDHSYGYSKIYPLFKYRYDYTKTNVYTTVLSNIHELKGLL